MSKQRHSRIGGVIDLESIVMQKSRPDQSFSGSQQNRLSELLDIRWDAEWGGRQLSQQESVELESLVDPEREGSTRRSATIAHEIVW